MLDDMGATLCTNVQDPLFNELAGFLTGISALLEDEPTLGKPSKIILKSPEDDTFIIHITRDNTAIALLSPRKLAASIISRKVERIIGVH
jgi:hypothetical protein